MEIDIGAEASSQQAGSKAAIQTRTRDRHADRFRDNAGFVTAIDAAFPLRKAAPLRFGSKRRVAKTA
jgi:hypothetical protein